MCILLSESLSTTIYYYGPYGPYECIYISLHRRLSIHLLRSPRLVSWYQSHGLGLGLDYSNSPTIHYFSLGIHHPRRLLPRHLLRRAVVPVRPCRVIFRVVPVRSCGSSSRPVVASSPCGSSTSADPSPRPVRLLHVRGRVYAPAQRLCARAVSVRTTSATSASPRGSSAPAVDLPCSPPSEVLLLCPVDCGSLCSTAVGALLCLLCSVVLHNVTVAIAVKCHCFSSEN